MNRIELARHSIITEISSTRFLDAVTSVAPTNADSHTALVILAPLVCVPVEGSVNKFGQKVILKLLTLSKLLDPKLREAIM